VVQHARVFQRVMTVNFLTPLYSTFESYLRDIIESALTHTYSHCEYCGADCSDKTHAYVGIVCREYAKKDGRIREEKLPKKKPAKILEDTEEYAIIR